MDQNYLINLVSGLFGSKKEVESQASYRPSFSDPSGLTGVARYMKRQEVVPVLSGVARYLKNLEELSSAYDVDDSLEGQDEVSTAGEVVGHLENHDEVVIADEVDQGLRLQEEAVLSLSSVAKYLEKLDQSPVSSVAKYMA
ncbi:MAG: hypothetical protein WAW41_20425, partial [Methylobacter sp.]